MIKHIKNNIKRSIIILSLAACLPACKDEFFDLPDRSGIDLAIWDTDGPVQMHLNRTYDVVVPTFPFQVTINERNGVHLASDENYFAVTDSWTRAALGFEGILTNNDVRWTGNRYNANAVAGENKYFDIQRCNEAIKYIPEGSLPEARKREYLGQYYALRAMTYFEMVKVYGGVPLILEPQAPESIYNEGRKSAKDCFAAILSDLDQAITLLDGFDPGTAGYGKMTKLIATCLKAKVLLYWASPQFNPTNDPKHPYVASRWQDALVANKAAYDMCIAAGKSLMPNYGDIFRVKGTSNTEAILVRSHSSTIERRGHDTEGRSRPSSENGTSYSGFLPSVKLIESYPMKDGNPPSSASADFPYDATFFWLNRDPRFDATIAYNSGPWALSGNNNRKQWSYNTALNETTGIGLYSKRFTTPSLPAASARYSNNVGGSGMDWIELRFAEVMLNYADCLNETGNESEAKRMVRLIRQRAGIVVGTNDFGLGNVAGTANVRTLILNERMIEFAFENKRNADLRRSRTMHLLSGSLQKVEFQLIRSSDKAVLEAPVSPGSTTLFRETIDFTNKAEFNKYFRVAYVNVSGNYGPYSIPEFHYFYTFHNDFVNNGNNILPTIGWAGGVFDPLD